jgi:hypothetical protein
MTTWNCKEPDQRLRASFGTLQGRSPPTPTPSPTPTAAINPSPGLFSAQSGGTNISGSLMQTGLGPLSCTNCNNLVRYGDYSGISLDGSSLSSSVIWVTPI